MSNSRNNSLLAAAAIAALTLALALPALGGKNDDLKKQAADAAAQGRLDLAEKAMCELAARDKEDPDAQQLCNSYHGMLPLAKKRNDKFWEDGNTALGSGDKVTARQKFQNIKWGDHLAEANAKIVELDDEIGWTNGTAAFAANDLVKAEAEFSKIKGAKAGEAAGYLTKIRAYNGSMQHGRDFLAKKDYNSAIAAFQEASNTRATDEAKAALDGARTAQAAAARTPGKQTGGTEVATNTPSGSTGAPSGQIPGGGTQAPVQSDEKKTAQLQRNDAVKATQFTFDTDKKMKDAIAAKARGDAGAAKALFAEVMAKEKSGAMYKEAKDALTELAVTARKEAAGAEADAMLISAIEEYYQGKYDDAAEDLRVYVRIGGRKSALGNFYIGAAKLTKYYLGNEVDKTLLQDARSAFRDVRQVAGFNPPDKFVSPRILNEYNQRAAAQ